VLEPDSRVALASHVLLRPEREGGLLYDALRNKLFCLDPEGFAVADACATGSSLDELSELTSQCGGSTAVTRQFLETLLATDMLAAQPLPASVSSGPSPERIARFAGHWQNLDHDQLSAISGPLLVYLELTHRCNLTCVYCYNNSGPTRTTQISEDAARALLEEFHRMGVFYVAFTGGEPLLRSDTLGLLELAGRYGIRQILSTNGTLISEQMADRLASAGVNQVQVSLDAADESTHDRIRGLSGAFRRSVAGIRILRKRDLPVTICCVATAESIPRLHGLAQLAVDLGVRNLRILTMMPVGRGQDLPVVCQDTRKTISTAVSDLAEKFAGQIRVVTHELQASGECGSGVSFCAISATGDVTPCSFASSWAVGNIATKSFREIWESSPQLSRFREMKKVRSLDSKAVGCAEGGCQASLMASLEGTC
jgi:radical SAM protein with 4Fe4S-binding SPASM domain